MQLNEGTYVFDCEGNSLEPTKIHCAVFETCDGVFEVTDYDEMRKAFLSAKVLIGHNIIRWDIPVLERILDIRIEARLVDTLALSWSLFPSRSHHGLEGWGDSFDIPKPEISDWDSLSLDQYLHRCREDVRITSKLWSYQSQKLGKLYDNVDDLNAYIDYLSFKMKCATLQEQNGWRLDQEYALSALSSLVQQQEDKVAVLHRVMPKTSVWQVKRPPKAMYKKDGSLSKLGEVWLDTLKELGYSEREEEIRVISHYEEPNPNSPQQIKDWLFSLGWEPCTFKQNAKGKEVPQISKEAQKGGGLTDSVLRLYDKAPELEVLDGLSILNARIPILKSWLNSPKLRRTGKLQAGVSGFTNTLRFCHSGLVNLPRTDRPYAAEIRGSLVADEGFILAGSDMSSLEDRTKQHFLYEFDPEYVESMDKPDWDPHLDVAVQAGMMSSDEADAYRAGDKSRKPIRDIAKNGNYAAVYGAGVKKLARTMGVSNAVASKFHKAYHQRNWSVRAVAERQVYQTIDWNGAEELWLKNPINNFWYSLRNTKDVFSTLNQGTADYCFNLYLGYILQSHQGLIGQFHDEFIFQIEDDPYKMNEFYDICHEAIDKLNNFLELNRKLDIGLSFGHRYSEIH